KRTDGTAARELFAQALDFAGDLGAQLRDAAHNMKIAEADCPGPQTEPATFFGDDEGHDEKMLRPAAGGELPCRTDNPVRASHRTDRIVRPTPVDFRLPLA